MKKVLFSVAVLTLGGALTFAQDVPVAKIGGSIDYGLKAVKVGDADFVTSSYSTDATTGDEISGATASISISTESDYYGGAISIQGQDSGYASLASTTAWYVLADGLVVHAGTAYRGGLFAGLSSEASDLFWAPGYGVTFTWEGLSLGASLAPVTGASSHVGLGLAYDLDGAFSVHSSAATSGIELTDWSVSASLSAVDYLVVTAGYTRASITKTMAESASASVAYDFSDGLAGGLIVSDLLTEGQYTVNPYFTLALNTDVGLGASYEYSTQGKKNAEDHVAAGSIRFVAGTGSLTFAGQYSVASRTVTLSSDYVLTL